MKANVYEAGPMRGRPEFGFPEFMGTEQDLRALDWVGDIFNPAQRDLDTGFDPTGMTGFENLNDGIHRFSLRDALGTDLKWIAERADVICLLPGWEMSSGALAEMALAAVLGLKAGALWEIALVDSPVDLRDAKDILDEMLDARAADRVKERQGMVEAPAITALKAYVSAHPDGPPSDDPFLFPQFFVAPAALRVGMARDNLGTYAEPVHPDGPPVLWDQVDYQMFAAPHVHTADGRCIKARSGQFCTPVCTSGLPLTGDVPASSLTPSNEVRLTSSTGGQKGRKLAQFDLIPVRPWWDVAELYGFGAIKYGEPRNWERGHDWSLSYAPLLRHANLFWSREDDDPESHLPHLAAVVFHALSLMEYRTTHPEFDDRPARLQLAQPGAA